MKTLVVDARESGTSSGRYVDKFIEHAHKLKPNYRIVLLAKNNRIAFLESIAPNFTTVRCDVKEFSFAEQFTLKKQIKSLKPDLVFFPFVQQPAFYRGRVVTNMQDLTTMRFRNPAKNMLVFMFKPLDYGWLNKRVAKKSLHILTISQFVKNDIVAYTGIPAKKITVTHLAADKISDAAKPISSLKGKEFIMYVGRPLPHKNLDRLIEAFVIIQKTRPALRLALVGKKDVLYERIEQLVKQRGISNIVFTGFATEGELRWLYENTAAYVFPSLSEGFGLPSVEAMMHGAPVVSSNASCLPEVNKDGAVYFDPLDVNDMSHNILMVLENKQIANKLVQKGADVAGSYSWTRMAKQVLAVIDRYM